ncbi:MAG: EI24 domain-containing protein [Bacteroidetes bacterium]|nr:EI24 domain-containing protein [Bacteroidota bacterium]
MLYYYIFPLLMSILLQVGLLASIFIFSRYLATGILGTYMPHTITEFKGFWSFLNIFSGFSIAKLLSFLIGIGVFLVGTKLSKYIVLIVLSPVFALLSEKVEEIVTGKIFPFNMSQLLKDILRGVIKALRNLFIEIGLIALFTLASFFAGTFNLLIVPILWLVSAYFYGFSMMDYVCERRKMSVSESVSFIRQNRGIALGNGLMYSVLYKIPFVGLCIAPINAAVVAVTSIFEKEKMN